MIDDARMADAESRRASAAQTLIDAADAWGKRPAREFGTDSLGAIAELKLTAVLNRAALEYAAAVWESERAEDADGAGVWFGRSDFRALVNLASEGAKSGRFAPEASEASAVVDRAESAAAGVWGHGLPPAIAGGEAKRVPLPNPNPFARAKPLDPAPYTLAEITRLAKEQADTTKRALAQLDSRVSAVENHVGGLRASAPPRRKEDDNA